MQARAVGAKLSAVESAHGIVGYTDVQAGLEKASEAKAAADESKGQTLEEIAVVVEEINAQIRAQKGKLAPQIKELRALRAQYQELEAEYIDKKVRGREREERREEQMGADVWGLSSARSGALPHAPASTLDGAARRPAHTLSPLVPHFCFSLPFVCPVQSSYENTAVGLDAELSKLQEEVGAYEEDIAKEESRYHYLNSLSQILDVSASRARSEAAGSTRIGDAYAARMRAQEEQTKDLRAQQRLVKENHDRNAGQIHLYKDLHRLLKCKVRARAASARRARRARCARSRRSRTVQSRRACRRWIASGASLKRATTMRSSAR